MQLIIALGGNLGDACAAFEAAIRALARQAHLMDRSSLYHTRALGPDQPDYLNAAILVATCEHPAATLARCQALELAAGRDRAIEARWGPRTLDLDILLAESVVIEGRRLTVPHPRLAERRFALLPAAELAPRWRHPRLRRTLEELAAALDPLAQPCERVGPFPT